VLQVSCASNRRVGVEPEWCQTIRKKPGEGSGEIHAHHQDASCSMNLLCERNCTISFQARSENTHTLDVSFQTVSHLIRDAAFLLRRGFEYGVWSDVIDEMLAKVGSEIRKALVT